MSEPLLVGNVLVDKVPEVVFAGVIEKSKPFEAGQGKDAEQK